MTSRAPEEPRAGDEVQRAVGLEAARAALGEAGAANVVIGPLCINNFSFTFSLKAGSGEDSRDLFIKIPKVALRGSKPEILPITSGDRKMARDEEDSLRLLGRKWDGDDLDVRWVNILGTVPAYNALITERVFADEAFGVFRRLDLRGRLGFRQDALRLGRAMGRLGTALGRFHRLGSGEALFRLPEALPKFEFYCREIAAGTGSAWPERIMRQLRAMGDLEIAGHSASTLKGIDIRNAMIDARDRIFLLDPGKIKITHREADLARFIMTYRILYWGSKMLLLAREPDPRAEIAFLESYYSQNQPSSPRLLSLFLLKEQLKHWHTALDSLRRRAWPPALKRTAASVYVNPFYARQVSAQLQVLTNNK